MVRYVGGSQAKNLSNANENLTYTHQYLDPYASNPNQQSQKFTARVVHEHDPGFGSGFKGHFPMLRLDTTGRKPLERLGCSVQEAAELLDCSVGTIWNLLKRGTLQSFVVGDLRKINLQHLRTHVVNKNAPIGPSKNPEGRYPEKSKKKVEAVKEPAE